MARKESDEEKSEEDLIKEHDRRLASQETKEYFWMCFSCQWMWHMSVDPIVFLNGVGGAVSMTYLRIIILERLCLFQFAEFKRIIQNSSQTINIDFDNVTNEVCTSLDDVKYARIEEVFEREWIPYNLYVQLAQAIPSAIVVIFCGNWSDKVGRKPAILLTTFGLALQSIFVLLFTYNKNLDLNLLVIIYAVTSVFGGDAILRMASTSYIVDVSSTYNRAFRIALLQGAMGAGGIVGAFLSAPLLASNQPELVMIIAAVCKALACIWSLLILKESKATHVHNSTHKNTIKLKLYGALLTVKKTVMEIPKLVSFDNLKAFKQMWQRKRNGKSRLHILLLCILLATYLFYLESDGSVMQIYLQSPPFSWSKSHFATFAAVENFADIGFMAILIPILNYRVHLPDTLASFVASFTRVFSYLVRSFATSDLGIYLQAMLGAFKYLNYVYIQTMLSKSTYPDEQGKVFAIDAVLMAITPPTSSAIASKLLLVPLEQNWDWKGLVWLVCAFVALFNACIFGYLHYTRSSGDLSRYDYESKIARNYKISVKHVRNTHSTAGDSSDSESIGLLESTNSRYYDSLS